MESLPAIPSVWIKLLAHLNNGQFHPNDLNRTGTGRSDIALGSVLN
jgi:hypothetical protein